MKEKKFKNCFINNIPNYEYQVKWQDEVFGTCKLMSQYAKSQLLKRNIQKTLDQNGNYTAVIKSSQQQMMIDYIYGALQSWQVDMQLTRQNIALMKQSVLVSIFLQIQKNEQDALKAVDQNEKN